MTDAAEALVPPQGVDPETAKRVDTQTRQALELAEAYTIDSPEMYTAAAQELKRIKGRYEEIEQTRFGLTRPLDATKKGIMAFFQTPLGRLSEAEKHIKRAMLEYDRKQERAREEARRQAEAEARRLQEEQERQWREEQARRKAEADAAEAEAIKRADELAAQGKQAEADQVLAEAEALERSAEAMPPPPAAAPPVPVVPETPHVSGISKRKNWKARVIDKKALLRAVLEGHAPLNLILVDEKRLNGLARQLQDELTYPGVQVYSEDTIASGRA